MMSVMFDPETAIYPFPAKPQPLTVDEKQFYREKIKRLLRERDVWGGDRLCMDGSSPRKQREALWGEA